MHYNTQFIFEFEPNELMPGNRLTNWIVFLNKKYITYKLPRNIMDLFKIYLYSSIHIDLININLYYKSIDKYCI